MSKAQRVQRSVPGMLSPRAKGVRKEPERALPKNEALRSPAPQVSWFARAREVALGTRFPKVIGGADPYLFGAVVALIVLQCVTIRLLRDTLHTLLAKGSARRQWPNVERKG